MENIRRKLHHGVTEDTEKNKGKFSRKVAKTQKMDGRQKPFPCVFVRPMFFPCLPWLRGVLRNQEQGDFFRTGFTFLAIDFLAIDQGTWTGWPSARAPR
jgi:hypothetical protein